MELLCPHCLKRVTVADDKSGQVLNCPLCNGVFAAPSLAPALGRAPAPIPPPVYVPPVTAPPPTVPNMEIAASAPVGMTPAVSPIAPLPFAPTPPAAPPPPPPQPPPRVEPPRPAPPPGDYTRKFAFRLRPEILVYVAPACIFMIFILSFFSWHAHVQEAPLNLWLLAFSAQGTGVFLAYVLFFFFLAFPLSVACLLFEQRWVPTPPPLVPLMPWKSLLTLAVLAVTFLLFCYDYQQGAVFGVPNPITVWERIAFRLHFVATAAAALEIWAQSQRAQNRPLPRFTLKW